MRHAFFGAIAVAGALLLAVFPAPLRAWDPADPDDPAAHIAAKDALKALGPDKGALTIDGEIRAVVGVNLAAQGKGLGIRGKIEELEKAIEDLGATVKEMEIQVELSSDVLFDFDKADIKPEAENELKKLALIIREKRKGDVLIYGHTDAKGSDVYNQKLSERRAGAVKSWLAEKGGVASGVIKTKGLGETQPVAPNAHPDGSDNPEGRAKNRRVEVVIQTVEKAG